MDVVIVKHTHGRIGRPRQENQMGFKTGKGNAYYVLVEELARTKAVLQHERNKPMLQSFAKEFCECLGTVLTTTPYEEWPLMAKSVFQHVAHIAPTAAHFYKQNLPS